MPGVSRQPNPTTLLRELLDHQERDLDVEKLAKSFLAAFGGYTGVVTSFKDVYDDCDAGSMAKMALMKSMMDVISKAAIEAHPTNRVADLSDEDLSAVIKELIASDEATNGSAPDSA